MNLKKILDKFGDLFTRPAKDYKREVDVVGYYLKDTAKFLSVQRGISEQAARSWIIKNLKPDGAFPFQDPKVVYLERQENGDREKKETTLTQYLGSSIKAGELIAPTFTTYLPPSKKHSLLSQFIAGNIKSRGVAKKAQFAAEAAKDYILAAIKKVEQTFRKLNNNAVSGAHCSPSQPLYNLTAHSTLTSVCRSTSGYGNANNEKFLMGNRHYFNGELVLNNLVAIANNVDYDKIAAVMAHYDLKEPSVADVMAAIKYSTQLYWWDDQEIARIQAYVEKMPARERTAFLYVGDAYQLMKLNPQVVRDLLTALSNKVEGVHPGDPLSVVKKAPESYVNLAHQICCEETQGIGKDYGTIMGTPAMHTVALTTENIADVVLQYADLIDAFWMTTNLPASVAHFPTSIRRSALTSDTDSTIFTVQDWVEWYSGSINFEPRSVAVYASMVFLASSTITNVLATMSANFGISEENLFKIAMKSEYSFPVFIPTQLGKHYFAAISCQEGNVKPELEWEIKGAQLKSANSPRNVIAVANTMMKQIIHTVMAGKKIRLSEYLTTVANLEREIIESIKRGERAYLRNSSIKDAGSYSGKPEASPYANHYLWNEVFGPRYGMMPNPPYETKKVSVDLGNPTKFKNWLASMEDVELRERATRYFAKTGKEVLTTFNLPVEILNTRGIPPEIERVVDFDKIVLDIVRPLYVILECVGFYAMGEKKVRRRLSSNGF